MMRDAVKNRLLPFYRVYVDRVRTPWRIRRVKRRQARLVQALKGQARLRVLFLVSSRSIWKLDFVFREMLQDDGFEPIILVVPNITFDPAIVVDYIESTVAHFQSLGYPALSAHDKKTGGWRPLEAIKPDILFFTDPDPVTVPEYYDHAVMNYLTCYAGYGMATSRNPEGQYNRTIHALFWKVFVQTREMLQGFQTHARKGNPHTHLAVDNIVLEIESRKAGKKPAAPAFIHGRGAEDPRLKIIYAPHHRILSSSALQTGTFLEYAEFFLRLAQETSSDILWSFKPHPFLRDKLYKQEVWGRDKTDAYFKAWEEGENTQFDNDEYIDLFMESDALILDCYSFLAEYCFTDKPQLYLLKDNMPDIVNDFGQSCLDVNYSAHSQADVLAFIEHLKAGRDEKQEARRALVRHYHDSLGKGSAPGDVLDKIREAIHG